MKFKILFISLVHFASFNYATAAYCVDATDPTPTITGLGCGTFSSIAGLSLNAADGPVDVSASTPGTYAYHRDPIAAYREYMAMAAQELPDQIRQACESTRDTLSKVSVVKKIAVCYKRLTAPVSKVCSLRGSTLSNPKLALAESELRVFSAIIQDSARECIDHAEAASVFRSKCTLDQPYMLDQQQQISPSNIGFYFSSAYLLVRSDALCYWPGTNFGNDLSVIIDESKFIDLSASLCSDWDSLSGKYVARSSAIIDKLTAALRRMQGGQ